MPYTPVTTNQAMTTSYMNTNWTDQVVSTVTSTTKPTGTEGQMIAVTNQDRIEIHDGTGYVRVGNYSASGRTGVFVRRNANQSIPTGTGTYTAISWDTETTDTDGFITATSDTITIPTGLGGLYSGMARVAWASSPGTNSYIDLLINATPYGFPIGAATQSTTQSLAIGAVAIGAGDTVKIRLSQGSGGAINVTAALQLWRISA